jgi:uncharacterized protein (TIGR02597 family)
MSKKFQILLVVLTLASAISAQVSGATVASVPEGMITFSLHHGTTSYLSLPLTNDTSYASTVSAVTATTISVGDSPAPFTTSLSTPAAPYFVEFTSGNEIGRVILVTGNTTNSLTLDTTDHNAGTPVFLTSTGFDVQVGDTFEIFPGDTLGSVFGTGTAQNPLLLTGAANTVMSDTISLPTNTNSLVSTFFFNTTTGFWQQSGSTLNANNTIIYPYSALTITRRLSHPDTTFVMAGRVTPVAPQIKIAGNSTLYTSTHFAADMTLSQLQFGSNWVKGTSSITADTLGVWNSAMNRFDTYYQTPDSTWRKYPDANTDASNVTIPAGSITSITKRTVVATGAASFIQSPIPYSLD